MSLQKNKAGIDLPESSVPSSMLYAFVGRKIVGRVSIRHTLNEYLRTRGGHVGYSVATKYRKRGYASEIFRLTLDECRKLSINPILITCGDTNIASYKIIEKFGGVLENKIWDEEDQETARRYWIQLKR